MTNVSVIAFPDDRMLQLKAAGLLHQAFPHANGWPTVADALDEVEAALGPDRICRAALDDDGDLIGWIGAMEMGYRGRVWELHPLVVAPPARGRGVGRALVDGLAEVLGRRGALTLCVGTDDEAGTTSLFGVDLYPAPLEHLRAIQPVGRHPFGFYLRAGFSLSGVVPDANGRGLPGILLARRVEPAEV